MRPVSQGSERRINGLSEPLGLEPGGERSGVEDEDQTKGRLLLLMGDKCCRFGGVFTLIGAGHYAGFAACSPLTGTGLLYQDACNRRCAFSPKTLSYLSPPCFRSPETPRAAAPLL